MNNKKNKIKSSNKKFLTMGQVYDTAQLSVQAIQAAVQRDLDSYFGSGMVAFNLFVTPLQVTMTFHRSTNVYNQSHRANPGMELVDADAIMITGLGYNGFRLPVMFPIAPYFTNIIQQSDFMNAYCQSARLLGADRVKWMDLWVDDAIVIVRIR